MRLFDSHIHLDEIDLTAKAPTSDYVALVPGITPDKTWGRLDDIVAAGHKPALALHPWHIPLDEPSGPRWTRLAEAAADPRVVAIGETGLDHLKHRDPLVRARARRWFLAHAQLADDLNKALVIHCVRAHGACLEVLSEVRPRAGGVVHAFSGSAEVMRSYDALGFRVGIGPAVTRARSRRVRAAAADAPPHQLLVETDAPYMAADQNDAGTPADLLRVVEVVAELRGVSPAHLAQLTWDNASALFG